MGPAAAWFSDSAERIASVWRDPRKRAQGRGAKRPTLLAISGGFLADQEDFDRALFGDPPGTGPIATEVNPPWDGVLAFGEVGFSGGADPTLYLAVHSKARLPPTSCRWPSGLRRTARSLPHRPRGPASSMDSGSLIRVNALVVIDTMGRSWVPVLA